MAYSTRVDEALQWASTLHRNQLRKSTSIPYVTHLLAVASTVGTFGGTEDQFIAALLHDSIEDCVEAVPDVPQQVERRFGRGVRDMVEACTDAFEAPKPPWKARKERYLKHLLEAAEGAPFLLVSLADKVHNAQCICWDLETVGDVTWERFNQPRDQVRWYYRSLADAFERKLPGTLAAELRRLVTRMGA